MKNILYKKGVYIIENIVTNKYYIGSTKVRFSSRFKKHLELLRLNKHHSKKLQRSYNKHGENSFKFRVLEVCETDQVRLKEQEWIDKMIPFYNMILIVDGGTKHNYKSKLKISRKQGGKPIDVCDISGNVIKTVNLQKEAADIVNGDQSKIYECLKGNRFKHKEHRFKYSGEDFNYVKKVRTYDQRIGSKHTEETKQKMKKAAKGRPKSENHRKELSKCMKNQWKLGIRKNPQERTQISCINQARTTFNGLIQVVKEDILFATFFSLKECSEVLGLNKSSIQYCLSGKRNKLYGYKFKKLPLAVDLLSKTERGFNGEVNND